MTIVVETHCTAKKIEQLESQLSVLKGSDVSVPTSLQLKIIRWEIGDLKVRLDVIQVKYDTTKKKIGHYIPQIQDFKDSYTKLCSAGYAKDKVLIATYNQVIHFQKIINRLELKELELQGMLKVNEGLKKELEELQHVYTGLLENNEHLKGEKVSLEAWLAQGQADFYKFGYVDHIFGRLTDYKFFEK